MAIDALHVPQAVLDLHVLAIGDGQLLPLLSLGRAGLEGVSAAGAEAAAALNKPDTRDDRGGEADRRAPGRGIAGVVVDLHAAGTKSLRRAVKLARVGIGLADGPGLARFPMASRSGMGGARNCDERHCGDHAGYGYTSHHAYPPSPRELPLPSYPLAPRGARCAVRDQSVRARCEDQPRAS